MYFSYSDTLFYQCLANGEESNRLWCWIWYTRTLCRQFNVSRRLGKWFPICKVFVYLATRWRKRALPLSILLSAKSCDGTFSSGGFR
jgi:hypothetical protein